MVNCSFKLSSFSMWTRGGLVILQVSNDLQYYIHYTLHMCGVYGLCGVYLALVWGVFGTCEMYVYGRCVVFMTCVCLI